MYRQIFIFFVLLLSLGKSLCGDDHDRIIFLEKEVERLKEQVDTLLVGKTSLPDSPPYVITGSLLYWYARTDGTAFSYSNSTRNIAVPIKGRTQNLDFDWQPGLRIGLGLNWDTSQWSLDGTFTHYSTNVSGEAYAGQGSSLIPLRGALVINSRVTGAKSSYVLDMNLIDICLAYHYQVGNKVFLHPFIGLKNGWINQMQVIRYTGGELGVNTERIDDVCDYWGLGGASGAQITWLLEDGLSLQGAIAGALLFGFFDIDHREKLTPNIDNQINLEDNKHCFIPTVSWNIGLTWSRCFIEQERQLDLSVAYEGMYWWSQNQMIKIYEYQALRYDNYDQDIAIHGITLTVKLHF